MRVGVVRESHEGERRVAGTPESVVKLLKLDFEVVVERGAGTEAGFFDEAYEEAGATLVDREHAWASDIVLRVQPPQCGSAADDGGDGAPDEVALMRPGATLMGFLQPDLHPGVLEALAARGVNVIAMEKVPRITRAQSMDALSSMANIAGYRSVIEAAQRFGSFFTPQFTAAGKVPPARVLIIGAGVAGLAAIGAARSLGAMVKAFDTRSAVKEQVESMGAEFLTVQIQEEGEGVGGYAKTMSKAFIEAELALFRSNAPELDIVITTALIPGKRAPTLWTKDMVEAMKPGSVIVDLAASQGGNCELTEPGSRVVHQGVHVVGYTDLTSRMPTTASKLFAANCVNLLGEYGGGSTFGFDLHDEIVRGSLVLRDGKVPELPDLEPADPLHNELPGTKKRRQTGQVPAAKPPPAPKPAPEPTAPANPAAPAKKEGGGLTGAIVTAAALLLAWGAMKLGGSDMVAEVEGAKAFLQHLTVFVLACVVGWHVIWNVTPALHTPLMSVTNAISGIIVLGGILFATGTELDLAGILGVVAILFATINIAGGFLVTQRMLRMFHR